MDNNKLIQVQYSITGSNEVINKLYGITDEIEDQLFEIGIKVQKRKNSAIKELNGLIKKYPFVPQFKNYLSALYESQGNHFMAQEVTRRIVVLHPEYLYGKLNIANIAISNNEFEKVPEILGKQMEIKALYPERDEFHCGEVLGFYKTAIKYFIGIKDGEQAQMRLDVLEKLNKEFDLGFDVTDLSRRIMFLNLGNNLGLQGKLSESRRIPEVIAKKVVEPTTMAPTFAHEIINQLYCNSLDINPQIIKDILSLPRETLLSDLHKVLYDSIARYEIFAEEDWDKNRHEFLMHALLLLTELKDESSIELILDLLRQDNEYLDFWFGDYLTSDFWELLYHIANDNLELLYSFVLEPNRYTYVKSCVSHMVEQVLLYQPERRLEVVDWYKRIFEFWIENKESDDLIDSDAIGFFICDVVNLNLVEIIPQMESLFNLGLVSIGIPGNFESCLKDINEVSSINRKIVIVDTLADRYEQIILNSPAYDDEIEVVSPKKTCNEPKEIVPLQDAKQKAGRNDPCPCGSGKKYKKCCGK
jgi:tetratricopeptide (TPR) repeat protein